MSWRARRAVVGVAIVTLAAVVHLLVPAVASASGRIGAAPTSPPVRVCGRPALLRGPRRPPPHARVVRAGDNASISLVPDTTYYFLAGRHTLGPGIYQQIVPARGDTFVGAPGAVIDGLGRNHTAFGGRATGVTIEYLTITDFTGTGSTQNAVNHTGARGWKVEHDTVETTTEGGALVLGTTSIAEYDCLTHNAQYGFSAFPSTGSTPTGRLTLSHDEISHNDGSSTGGGSYTHPGSPHGCGCSGGGKFWEMRDATVTTNWVHDNGFVGIWVDTNNRGFLISHNFIDTNYAAGIIYEISYNFVISDNTLVRNTITQGRLDVKSDFPTPTIYIFASGGTSRLSGRFAGRATIVGNRLTDNWGGVVLYENANRACGVSTTVCTLRTPRTFTLKSCAAHLPRATPRQRPDYYDGCQWKTKTVTVAHNTFRYSPKALGQECTAANWCAYNALFAPYGTTAPWKGFVVATLVSNRQHNRFLDNAYCGPWHFDAFTQGTPVSWRQWHRGRSTASSSFHAEDAGSTYTPTC